MNINAIRERLFELSYIGHVGKHTQLDLAVIRRHQLIALVCDKGSPNLTTIIGANRNVLKIRVRRGKTPGRCRRHSIRSVDPFGVRIDKFRQGIGIGRLQFGELSPVNDPARQVMPLGCQALKHLSAGCVLARFGFLAARQAQLAKQDFTQLFGRTHIKFLARELVYFRFDSCGFLRKLTGKTRQDLPVNGNASRFHPADHIDKRPFKPFVNMVHALSGEARFQYVPEPQSDIGILGRIGSRFVNFHLRK